MERIGLYLLAGCSMLFSAGGLLAGVLAIAHTGTATGGMFAGIACVLFIAAAVGAVKVQP